MCLEQPFTRSSDQTRNCSAPRRGPLKARPGTDVDHIFYKQKTAYEITRNKSRPTLVVASVYRFRGHYEGDLDLYRPAGEKKEGATAKDPVHRLRQRLLDDGTPPGQLAEAQNRASESVTRWFCSARQRPPPPRESAREHVFASADD